MTTTSDIVAKLWNLCHVLRDDGVSYSEYVTELTYLLFLKMLEETKREDRLPAKYRWAELAKREGLDQLDHYKQLLLDLGKPDVKDGMIKSIFTDAQTKLRKPTNLKALTTAINQLDWFSAREEGLGRPVFHAAPSHRLHRAADEAAGWRDHSGPGSRNGRFSGGRRSLHQACD